MKTTALVATLLLIACAGASTPRTHYLLRTDVPEQTLRVDPPVRVGLRKLVVAPYLDQPGLVVETEPRQVRPARHHLWAEPLDEGLRRVLRAEISKALGYDVSSDAAEAGQWDYSVDVRVERLHGDMSGRALLVASWRIARGPGAKPAAAFRFARSAALPREGYAGLVEAQIDLARQLSLAIAGSLGEVGGSALGADPP